MRRRGTADPIDPSRKRSLIDEMLTPRDRLDKIVFAICGEGTWGPHYAIEEHIKYDPSDPYSDAEIECVSYCHRCELERRIRKVVWPLLDETGVVQP